MLKLGLVFKDYESSGSGISKHTKKTGASLFFDILGRKFWLLMGINLLYTAFFIPLLLIFAVIRWVTNYAAAYILIGLCVLVFAVTIGPATAGMFKIMRNYLIEKHTYIIRDFFKAFKTNFKKASVIGFLNFLVVLSSYASLNVYPVLAQQLGTKLIYIPMIITLSLALIVFIMNYYIYLMLVATTLSLKNLIKNSFALSFVAMKRNLLTSLIAVVTIVIMIVLLLYVTPIFLTIIPIFPAAFLCFVVAFNSYPVIQKYVINPYYTSIGQINPELLDDTDDEEAIFEDMGGKEQPIEKRQKGKGRRIS